MCFGVKLSPAFEVAWAGADTVPLELLDVLELEPDAVGVVTVLRVPVAFESEPLATAVPVAVLVAVDVNELADDEVWAKTPPEAEEEEEAEEDAAELDLVPEAEAEAEALLPRLDSPSAQVPLELMLW